VVSGAFDAGFGVGAIAIGAVIGVAGFRPGFAAATGFMVAALACLRGRFRPAVPPPSAHGTQA
jgi:hypothetical protein